MYNNFISEAKATTRRYHTMWNRKDLKMKGKIAFKANYWKSVLVALLAMIMTAGGSAASSRQGFNSATEQGNGGMTGPESLVIAGIIIVTVIIVAIITVAITVFLLNPLKVGCDNFFLSNRRDPSTELDALSFGFKSHYKNVVKVSFMRDLYVFLWTLLFIIPGIIKAYEYRMVSYILTENPNIDYKDALQQSKDMMYGHKMNAFVLDLSFIGWLILGALTFGLLDLFYVNPYIQATNAELYVALAHPEESNNVVQFKDAAAEPTVVEFDVE